MFHYCQGLSFIATLLNLQEIFNDTGSPPFARVFGLEKNCVKGKPCNSRSILVLKPKNGTFFYVKSPLFKQFYVNVQCKRAINDM